MNDQPITQRIAMKAVIVRDSKVLVLREADTYEEGTNIGRYGMPGGRINPGEPFIEGLKREVLEETGLEIEVGIPVYVSEWFPVIKGIPHQIVGTFIECRPLSTDITLSEEHDDYRWVDAGEALDLNLIPTEADAVKAYYSR